MPRPSSRFLTPEAQQRLQNTRAALAGALAGQQAGEQAAGLSTGMPTAPAGLTAPPPLTPSSPPAPGGVPMSTGGGAPAPFPPGAPAAVPSGGPAPAPGGAIPFQLPDTPLAPPLGMAGALPPMAGAGVPAMARGGVLPPTPDSRLPTPASPLDGTAAQQGLLPTVIPAHQIVAMALRSAHGTPQHHGHYALGGEAGDGGVPARYTDAAEHGPPPPSGFVSWLESTPAARTNDTGLALLAAYQRNPADAPVLYHLARDIAFTNPADLPDDLKGVIGA